MNVSETVKCSSSSLWLCLEKRCKDVNLSWAGSDQFILILRFVCLPLDLHVSFVFKSHHLFMNYISKVCFLWVCRANVFFQRKVLIIYDCRRLSLEFYVAVGTQFRTLITCVVWVTFFYRPFGCGFFFPPPPGLSTLTCRTSEFLLVHSLFFLLLLCCILFA